MDLCRGPHIPSTGKLKAFKLLNVAGAYWRGIPTAPCCSGSMERLLPRRKILMNTCSGWRRLPRRDHRRLGKELDLFSIQDEGQASPSYIPMGW